MNGGPMYLSTPGPLQWDCFMFGVIQRDDHFTFYVVVDHVHTDPILMAVLYMEIHMMYGALAGGGAPLQLPQPSGYDDYCVKQHEFTSALTLESPQVRTWIDYAESNDGTLPEFPLPLGEYRSPVRRCPGRTVDGRPHTARFESACIDPARGSSAAYLPALPSRNIS